MTKVIRGFRAEKQRGNGKGVRDSPYLDYTSNRFLSADKKATLIVVRKARETEGL